MRIPSELDLRTRPGDPCRRSPQRGRGPGGETMSRVRYEDLGLDREALLDRVREWQAHARALRWPSEGPRARRLARAWSALVDGKESLALDEVYDVLCFGIATPLDDALDEAIDAGREESLSPEERASYLARRKREADAVRAWLRILRSRRER